MMDRNNLTPSSTATTSTTTSVAEAPFALIEVNAAWPGVSRKTTDRSFTANLKALNLQFGDILHE
jgi:hypothetical protein